jgi:hypothetical protein
VPVLYQQVNFTGNFSQGVFGHILLDDISFSKMKCLEIPAIKNNLQGRLVKAICIVDDLSNGGILLNP